MMLGSRTTAGLSAARVSVRSSGRSLAPAPVPVLVLVLVLAWSPRVSGVLTEDQEETLVELHNRYRGIVQPSASVMLPLKWDRALKVVAEGYAANCVWNHNPELEETGENLFAGTGSLDLERALEKWFLEHLDYNYYNNSCDDDKMCGHYTQMVWADTHRVGCAVHVCAQMEGLDWTEPINFLVCNYYPAGNYEGERPYVEGDWCSQCPENLHECENNLCVTDGPEPDQNQDPDQNPDQDQDSDQDQIQDQDQDPDQDQDQDLMVQKVVGTENLGEEQEAVVPPQATETLPEPLTTTETGSGSGLEPESPSEGPAGGAVVHTDEAETPPPSLQTPPPFPHTPPPSLQTPPPQPQTPRPQTPPPQTPPPLPQTPPPRHQTPPPRPQTPPPVNRGQKQKNFVEKKKRDKTMVQSRSTVHSASGILVFIWICLNLV